MVSPRKTQGSNGRVELVIMTLKFYDGRVGQASLPSR